MHQKLYAARGFNVPLPRADTSAYKLPLSKRAIRVSEAREPMAPRRRYRKRVDRPVIAVCLNLDTKGFSYRKWGDEQRCKRGDWLVDNDGEIYTVDAEVFARTYRPVGPAQYAKATAVWAQVADAAGSVPTKEGVSHYAAGDYLVSNNEDGTDAYCMTAEKFESMYEPDR
jgi:hypothetical protein